MGSGAPENEQVTARWPREFPDWSSVIVKNMKTRWSRRLHFSSGVFVLVLVKCAKLSVADKGI